MTRQQLAALRRDSHALETGTMRPARVTRLEFDAQDNSHKTEHDPREYQCTRAHTPIHPGKIAKNRAPSALAAKPK